MSTWARGKFAFLLFGMLMKLVQSGLSWFALASRGLLDAPLIPTKKGVLVLQTPVGHKDHLINGENRQC